jgi:uncharacterized protein YyaL (SSP411 family)
VSEERPNRLAHSASPYLRSAANQPVDWYEWGTEAFARARAEDKPILLDIGAVWCHWCHVIDRESYENPELAALINRLFVPVKVDRDERPDVDTRYQTAVNAISGQGGWPLTGFLLPDGRPFYGGTYFPPVDAMGRPSFRRVLESIADTYRMRRGEVEEAATALVGAVSQAEVFATARGDWSPQLVDLQVAAILERFDARYGGFGRGPKFPHSAAVDLILERYQATHDPQLLHVAQTTLEKMARGGVYDQLAGGFHRYSVDERWLVPHFEKMSYDNSELLKNYLHGYQVTRNPFFLETAAGIVGWVNAVLSDQQQGGFYASQDADISLDDDGDYFTWTLEEVRAVLPPEDSHVIEFYYDVGADGEMHHNPAKNVLWIAREPAAIAQALGISEDDVRRTILRARAQLLEARAQRPTPYVDTTLYTSWNAMFISAYLEAAAVFESAAAPEAPESLAARESLDALHASNARPPQDRAATSVQAPATGAAATSPHTMPTAAAAIPVQAPPTGAAAINIRDFALRTLDRFLAEAWDDRRGFSHRLGGERLDGSLDDQVFMAAALLDAFEATLDRRYFDAAERAAKLFLEKFADPAGGFFDRSSEAAPMGGLDVRRKPLQDSPTPGANAVAIIVLDRLHDYTGNAAYRERAEATLAAFAGGVAEYGLFAATFGLASVLHARHPIQIVVTGATDNPLAAQLERAARLHYRFGKGVLRVAPGSAAAANASAGSGSAVATLPPSLQTTLPHLRVDQAQAFVCAGGACYPPVNDPAKLSELLARVAVEARAGAG